MRISAQARFTGDTMSTQEQTERLLTLAAVEKRVGLRKTRLYQLMAKQKFPLPIQPGGYKNYWLESEIDAFMERLKAARPSFVVGRG